MERQTTLALDEPDYLTPARTEPAVWVKELRILADPSTLIRTVPLRPGLNIVWAPDRRSAAARTGHAAGKTLLCRLLRFLLGDPSFATRRETKAIREALPQGLVLGRVHVLGRTWTVRRSLAEDAPDRADCDGVSENATLSSGWSAYCAALTSVVSHGTTTHFSDWLDTLEWISRDQRCLDGIFAWRRGNKQVGRRAATARALLRIPAPEGVAKTSPTAAPMDEVSSELTKLIAEIEVLEEQLGHSGGAEVPSLRTLDAPVLRAILEHRLAELQNPPVKPEALAERERALRTRRTEHTILAEQAAAARAEAQHLVAEVIRHERALGDIESHQDDAQATAIRLCSRCKRPLHDPADVAVHRASLEDEATAAREKLDAARHEQAKAAKRARELEGLVHQKRELVIAEEAEIAQAYEAYERESRERTLELARAEQKLRSWQRLDQVRARKAKLMAERPTPPAESPAQPTAPHPPDPSQMAALRSALTWTTKRLFSSSASVEASPTEHGLDVKYFDHEGHSASGPGLTALGVLAFDLAALRLAIADRADLPGLWIHDAPRDGGPGPGSYDSYLDALLALQRQAEQAFQFILTTTDEPPASLQDCLVPNLELGSGDDKDLLLRRRF